MDSGQDRLLQFDRDLLSGKNICSSEVDICKFSTLTEETFSNERTGADYLPPG